MMGLTVPILLVLLCTIIAYLDISLWPTFYIQNAILATVITMGVQLSTNTVTIILYILLFIKNNIFSVSLCVFYALLSVRFDNTSLRLLIV